MKISEITDQQIKEYCGMDDDATILPIYKAAAKSFILSHTGITADELDMHDDLTIAYCVLINDMSCNRDYVVGKNILNPTVSTILSMHSRNNIG